jgi:prepilin-type N-terminal cleavage/methylation domain-containing protein
MRTKGSRCEGSSGFTLLEAMIAIVILGGGLLALAVAFSQGMVVMSTSHFHQIAKEKASEAMESVFTSRDARKITNWNLIQNRSHNGIFLDGLQPLRSQGPDGLVNTLDDGDVEVYEEPGPDNIVGTDDDVRIVLNNFQREIEITNIAPNLRQIRVVVSYTIGHLNRQYELTAFISPFA